MEGAARQPSLASDGKTLLVTWLSVTQQGRSIRAKTLSFDLSATISPTTELSQDIATSTAPVASHSADDNTYVVVWRAGAPIDGLIGTWIRASDGVILDPGGERMTASVDPTSDAALSAGTDGDLLLTFVRRHVASGGCIDADSTSLCFGAPRVWAHALTSGKPNGCACDSGNAYQCATRLCVDGVCCEKQCGPCQRCSHDDGSCEERLGEDPCPGHLWCSDAGAGECLTSCQHSRDCASGFQCFSDGTCREPDRHRSLARCSTSRLPSDFVLGYLFMAALAVAALRRVTFAGV